MTISRALELILDQDSEVYKASLLYLKVLNGLLIGLLLSFVAIALMYALKTKSDFNKRAVKGALIPLSTAILAWGIAYALDVLFAPEIPKAARIASSYLNWTATGGFFVAGWTLLSLKGRVHRLLPPPSKNGVSLSRLHNLTQHTPWLIVYLTVSFVALTTLIVAFPDPEISKSSQDPTSPLNLFEIVINTVGMLVLAMGFLRELNRNDKEYAGMLPAIGLVLYALTQPFIVLTWAKVPLYTLGIVFKWTWSFGLIGFWPVGRESGRAELAIREREKLNISFSEMQSRLLAISRSARHRIKNIGWEMAVRLKLALEQLPESPIAKQEELARIQSLLGQIEDTATELLTRTQVEAQIETTTAKQITERVTVLLDGLRNSHVISGQLQCPNALAPYHEFVEVLCRIVENAAQAGAKTITLSNQSCRGGVVYFIDNDGPAMSEHWRNRLFNTRQGGFWSARQIVTSFGGRIELDKSDDLGTLFKVYLPDDWNAHEKE